MSEILDKKDLKLANTILRVSDFLNSFMSVTPPQELGGIFMYLEHLIILFLTPFDGGSLCLKLLYLLPLKKRVFTY